MKTSKKSYSVRLRLTLWYTTALASIMVFFSAAVYLYVRSSLLGQLDHELQRDSAGIVALLQEEGDDIHDLHETEEFKAAPIFLIIKEGRRLFATTTWRSNGLDKALTASQNTARFLWTSPTGVNYRINATHQKVRNGDYLVVVAHKADATLNSLRTLGLTLIIGLPFILLPAILGGWFMAGRALKPVASLAATAREITAESLDKRLPVINPHDEFGALASVFNDTLARLQNSFDLLHQFTSDASHELRTPLTALRSVGEVGLHAETDPESCRDIIGSMLEEADRLAILVDNLLTLTRLDNTCQKEQTELLNLTELLHDVVRCLHVLAEEKGQTLTLSTDEPIIIKADSVAIRQAVTNLLDNAIKYTPHGGSVHIYNRQLQSGEVILEIIDNGPGIEPQHQTRIFERFYRVADDRSSETGGSGLGLAIAQQAIERSGGKITLETNPGNGCKFSIRFPPAQKGGSTQI